eukprot:251711_1
MSRFRRINHLFHQKRIPNIKILLKKTYFKTLNQCQTKKDQDEAASLIENVARPLMGLMGGMKAEVVKAGAKIINEELNEKRLVFTITIKNHYDILNKQTSEKWTGFKLCCWKYACCGLWTCRNCCCKKRCLCSCCCMISTDSRITKNISKKLTERLNKEEVKHQMTVLNSTDIEIVLAHVAQSWYEKAKEVAIEQGAPYIISMKIEKILKTFGCEATIRSHRRKVELDESIEPKIDDEPQNDGKYL